MDEGTACTQSSFKAGKTAFLYIGPQGGRFKAMFKLGPSRAEAERLAREQPDRFEVGSTAWVTARFSADEPMPKALWQRWLDESHGLSGGGGTKKASAKKAPRKKAVAKKATAKKATAQKASAKKTTRKKATRKKAAAKTSARKTTRKQTAQKASAKKTSRKKATRRRST